jgi:phosphoribosylanthranilate isomerase
VPAFVSRVGLFMDQDCEDVARILDRVPLNLLQFHGSEDAAYCRQFGQPYVKALSMAALAGSGLAQAAQEFSDAAALLLDSHGPGEEGGTGRRFDWAQVPRLNRPVILAGGLTPDNVREAVRQVRPWAVDVSSGVEDAPGVKNVQKMQLFIREAKSEY